MIKWSNRHWQAVEWVSTGILVGCTLLYNHQVVSNQWLLVSGGGVLIILSHVFGWSHYRGYSEVSTSFGQVVDAIRSVRIRRNCQGKTWTLCQVTWLILTLKAV